MADQPSRPVAQRSHSLEGLVASPGNLHAMPIMAIGSDRGRDLPLAAMMSDWQLSIYKDEQVQRGARKSFDICGSGPAKYHKMCSLVLRCFSR
jgi:hypothetical protein